MIDPKDFLNRDKKVESDISDDSINISGTFMCQECNETVRNAKLDEVKRKIVWYCSNKHYSEARL